MPIQRGVGGGRGGGGGGGGGAGGPDPSLKIAKILGFSSNTGQDPPSPHHLKKRKEKSLSKFDPL